MESVSTKTKKIKTLYRRSNLNSACAAYVVDRVSASTLTNLPLIIHHLLCKNTLLVHTRATQQSDKALSLLILQLFLYISCVCSTYLTPTHLPKLIKVPKIPLQCNGGIVERKNGHYRWRYDQRVMQRIDH